MIIQTITLNERCSKIVKWFLRRNISKKKKIERLPNIIWQP